jgi:ABC-type Mn2+/Zn2+ transport system ATPase subunit
MNLPVLKIQDLIIGYPGRALSTSLQLQLEEGETLGILGTNGSGKSTLLRTLLGLNAPLSGGYYWQTGVRFGFVPQENKIDPLFPLTVRDVLRMGARSGSTRLQLQEILSDLEMNSMEHRLFRKLSGGLKQRVLLGRALLGQPDVLLLDEPFNNLDYGFRLKLVNRFQEWKKNKRLSLLLIEHDINRILHQVDKMILLGPHRSFAGGTPDLVKKEILEAAYEVPLHVHDEDGKLQIHFL